MHACTHARRAHVPHCAVRRCLPLPGHVPTHKKKRKATPLQLMHAHGTTAEKKRERGAS
jgi:hypothetical protein